jgi:hypothetical protein
MASAADNHTSGRHGLLAGNQVSAPVHAPVGGGNAVSGSGASSAAPQAAAAGGSAPAGSQTTSGDVGVGSGSQVVAPVGAPVGGGNGVGGFGAESMADFGSGSTVANASMVVPALGSAGVISSSEFGAARATPRRGSAFRAEVRSGSLTFRQVAASACYE